MRQRLGLLLEHNINLLAYHLPLDAHEALGNNAQLGELLGLQVLERFGEQKLGFLGALTHGKFFSNAQDLAHTVETVLRRPIVLVPGRDGPIRRIAWCTGGAQSYFEGAIAAGADAFHAQGRQRRTALGGRQ